MERTVSGELKEPPRSVVESTERLEKRLKKGGDKVQRSVRILVFPGLKGEKVG